MVYIGGSPSIIYTHMACETLLLQPLSIPYQPSLPGIIFHYSLYTIARFFANGYKNKVLAQKREKKLIGWSGGVMLANQQYTNCIRQEQGYCSITYAAAPSNFAVS